MASDAALLKLWAWGEAHKKQLLVGLLTVVVLGFGVGFFFWHQGQNETNASEALSQVTGPSLVGGPPVSTEALLKIVADYPNTAAAEQALVLAGGRFFAEGRPAEAQAQFEKYMREHRDGPFAGQAMLGRATALEAQGKIPDALAAYKDISDHHPLDSVAPQARFALGRLYEAQGNFEQAQNLYAQVARQEYGSLGSQAAQRLQQLMITHPPTPPPMTGATNTPMSGPANNASGSNSAPFNLRQP